MTWTRRRGGATILSVAAIVLLAGCSSTEELDIASLTSTSQPPTTAAAPTTTAPPTTTAVTTSAPATPTSTSQPATTTTSEPTELNPFGGNDPEDFLMPDVVCMGLQTAQDEIQDHGVFFARSEDATGAGRMQIMDSNWIVVDQTPAPGTPIGEGEAILYVVKLDEPNPC